MYFLFLQIFFSSLRFKPCRSHRHPRGRPRDPHPLPPTHPLPVTIIQNYCLYLRPHKQSDNGKGIQSCLIAFCAGGIVGRGADSSVCSAIRRSGCRRRLHLERRKARSLLAPVMLLLHKQIQLVEPVTPGPVLLLIIGKRLQKADKCNAALVFYGLHTLLLLQLQISVALDAVWETTPSEIKKKTPGGTIVTFGGYC